MNKFHQCKVRELKDDLIRINKELQGIAMKDDACHSLTNTCLLLDSAIYNIKASCSNPHIVNEVTPDDVLSEQLESIKRALTL